MTRSELVGDYETEIVYREHMLENLGRWLTLLLAVTSLGFLLVHFFDKQITLLILDFASVILGSLGMITFGYDVYHGKKNLVKVIDDFEIRLQLF